jgi:uncharacterized protein (DUF58 family)
LSEELSAAQRSELYRRARALRLAALRRARTELAGVHASAFRGRGVEFAGLRGHEPGDDVRRIDWRVFARRRRLMVRDYVEERRLRVILAVDVSRSMDRAGGGRSRELAWQAAGTIALSAALAGDSVGALLFGQRVLACVPPRVGERHALSIACRLLAAPADGTCTDLAAPLEALSRLRHHAVAFLVTDFLTSPPPWAPPVAALLAACARRHDLRALHLRPAAVCEPGPGAIVRARVAESGRPVAIETGLRAPTSWAGIADRHAERTRQALSRAAVPLVEVRSTDGLGLRLRKLLLAGRQTHRGGRGPDRQVPAAAHV